MFLGGYKEMTTTTLKASIVSFIAVSAFVISPLAGATPGNNGTLKVHEKDTPSRTESNDPKVCVFNFEGYGFDKGQSGVIVISSQMNGKDKVGIKQVDMPAANAEGYTETEYVTVPSGHYKTTLFGKDVHGNPDYNKELKAKSKVIKVQCAEVAGDSTTPTTPDTQTPTTPDTQTPATPDKQDGHITDTAASTTTTDGKGEGKTLGTTTPTVLPATGISALSILSTLGIATVSYATALRFRK